MPQEQAEGSNQENVQTESKSNSEQKEEYVPRKAYEEQQKDMFKFKSKAKDQAAKITQLEADAKAREEAELEQQQNYQELAKRMQEERDKALADSQASQEKVDSALKRAALKSELGKVNDLYLVHADLSAIELNEDGLPSSESVKIVANKFREEHAALLPKVGGRNITDVSGANTSDASIEEVYEDALAKTNTQKEFDAVRARFNRE